MYGGMPTTSTHTARAHTVSLRLFGLQEERVGLERAPLASGQSSMDDDAQLAQKCGPGQPAQAD